MGLPWRFISVSAGTVTFVLEWAVLDVLGGVELPPPGKPPGKLARLMLSPVPLRGLRMRPEQDEYTVYGGASAMEARKRPI